MPDQRGFAGSDLPQDVDDYKTDTLVDDIFALADALGIERFALVGHDWGGAIAWAAALRGDPRLTRLAIVNSPHPVIFQKSLIEDADQRAASQYINAFRAPGFEKLVEEKGFDWFFDTTFARHVDVSDDPDRRAAAIYRRLVAAGRVQRHAQLVSRLEGHRAAAGRTLPLPDFLLRAFPSVKVPTLVIWGMQDKALLPIQLEGLDTLVDDLAIVRLPDAGHFAPWEAPDAVARRSGPSLPRTRAASAARIMIKTRSRSRSAARLAAVQALYQHEMEGTPLPRLLKEFHDHRLGATIEDATYHDAEQDFFDDLVSGADARRAEIDALISDRLAEGWTPRAARPADARDPARRSL